jgi:TfoX/Sxy family transcriptional regulator of competence genes
MDPLWKKREELLRNPEQLQEIIRNGSEKARKAAKETMILVREAMGLSAY